MHTQRATTKKVEILWIQSWGWQCYWSKNNKLNSSSQSFFFFIYLWSIQCVSTFQCDANETSKSTDTNTYQLNREKKRAWNKSESNRIDMAEWRAFRQICPFKFYAYGLIIVAIDPTRCDLIFIIITVVVVVVVVNSMDFIKSFRGVETFKNRKVNEMEKKPAVRIDIAQSIFCM